MHSERHPTPRRYLGVMVSSTFTDLAQHRLALIEAINGQALHEIAMENDSAKLVDVINSSLQMVQDGAAYISVISHKYGQIPQCLERNPNQLSITELEFNEAQRLKRPILLFIMGEDHHVRKADVETDPIKLEKLNFFRERAKLINPSSQVHRVYATFHSLEEFSKMAIQSVAELRRYLDESGTVSAVASVAAQTQKDTAPRPDPIPTPPVFYAEPPYIGSHMFVGRHSQLETISDWANPADSHPVLLFEAIGGTGKSMLTWEWTTKHSPGVRSDWAGRFWYSFYEKGATMLDFCRRALAYMTRQPRASFKENNTFELTELLIHQLQAHPWLFILDGLERVLVSYHRFDASQFRDEEAGTSDMIAHRDPCSAINPEDDDLLRALAGASPSKLLLTSRLIPKVLLNRSNQPIPGVLREHLPGLRPKDAETLFFTCGVKGTSQNIQRYLKSNCDCHPLVIGVLAGLINDYLPDRGNFDAWVVDPIGGGQLNLAKLDLVQKRNHILNAAFSALPEPSRQLLSTLALLPETIEYSTICALNPYLSPVPVEIPIPKSPEHGAKWRKMSEIEKSKALEHYEVALRSRNEYENALVMRDEEMRLTANDLTTTIKDLERRGLLQYDALAKRYNLHPVVRGISLGGLKHEEKNLFGQRVVDHFSQRAQDPYEQAERIEDLDNARHIVQALFQMGKLEQARHFVLNSRFLKTLIHKFEAHNDILIIVKPFFSSGWKKMPPVLENKEGVQLARTSAVALRRIGALQDAFDISETALRSVLRQGNNNALFALLLDLASTAGEQNRLALEQRLLNLARKAISYQHDLFSYRLARFRQLSRLGIWADALEYWGKLYSEVMPTDARALSAHHYVVHLFLRDDLTEAELLKAEELNMSSKSALGRRNLCALRGYWHLERKDFELAKKCLNDAVALAHKSGKIDRRSEIRLAIAKHNLMELHEPCNVAEQFGYNIEEHCHHALADLCFAIGDVERAKEYALAAYKWAWADGEPFVHRNELNKIKALIENLGLEIPTLQKYDPSREIKLSWEGKVVAVIDALVKQLESSFV